MTVVNGLVTASTVNIPGLYVGIVPPQAVSIQGVPTNIIAVVGTAAWGPKNVPVVFSGLTDGAQLLGNPQNRKYDLMTQVMAAQLAGGNNFRGVRVTDGTDVAASVLVQTSCITFTAFYTGTEGNQITVRVAPGSQASTYKVTVAKPGLTQEVFDNLASGASGNDIWVAIASAINNGTSSVRGPSKIITATAGVGVTAPATATYTLASGTDGVGTITDSVLIGSDTTPRTGMYALRNSKAAIMVLADVTAYANFSTQLTYGISEGTMPVVVGPAGESISSAISNKTSASLDPTKSWNIKVLLGDYVYINDTVNNLVRLISPQGFWAGVKAAYGPQNASLNKPINGIVGSQSTYANSVYSDPELQLLANAGIDVITNPSVGGNYFSARIGYDASPNPLTRGDNYPTLTNFLAYSINASMGVFVGRLKTPEERSEAFSALDNFLDRLNTDGIIGDSNGGTPFQIVIGTNDPIGVQTAYVRVKYLDVVFIFIINIEGGAAVVIPQGAQPASQAGF